MKETNENMIPTKTNEALEKPIKDRLQTDKPSPIFVEAEKMFEKWAEITRETASKAFELFRQRGGEWGKEIDDWFKAEREVLRPMPLEIRESGNNILVTAAVPGFKPEEIEVSVKDDQLLISGKTEAKLEKEEEQVVLKEWKSDRLFRRLTLPSPVLADKVTAKLKDGMLELTLPKAAKKEATKISVAGA